MTTLREAALDYARRGIPIFPCNPGLKTPATKHGFHDATTDPHQIEAWWPLMIPTPYEEYNIAFCPDDVGLFVLDLDGPEGFASWVKMLATHGWQGPALQVGTPSGGGRHIYFKGRVPSSVKKVAAGIDVRGIGGYVLLPPSIVNGKPYHFIIVPS